MFKKITDLPLHKQLIYIIALLPILKYLGGFLSNFFYPIKFYTLGFYFFTLVGYTAIFPNELLKLLEKNGTERTNFISFSINAIWYFLIFYFLYSELAQIDNASGIIYNFIEWWNE